MTSTSNKSQQQEEERKGLIDFVNTTSSFEVIYRRLSDYNEGIISDELLESTELYIKKSIEFVRSAYNNPLYVESCHHSAFEHLKFHTLTLVGLRDLIAIDQSCDPEDLSFDYLIEYLNQAEIRDLLLSEQGKTLLQINIFSEISSIEHLKTHQIKQLEKLIALGSTDSNEKEESSYKKSKKKDTGKKEKIDISERLLDSIDFSSPNLKIAKRALDLIEQEKRGVYTGLYSFPTISLIYNSIAGTYEDYPAYVTATRCGELPEDQKFTQYVDKAVRSIKSGNPDFNSIDISGSVISSRALLEKINYENSEQVIRFAIQMYISWEKSKKDALNRSIFSEELMHSVTAFLSQLDIELSERFGKKEMLSALANDSNEALSDDVKEHIFGYFIRAIKTYSEQPEHFEEVRNYPEYFNPTQGDDNISPSFATKFLVVGFMGALSYPWTYLPPNYTGPQKSPTRYFISILNDRAATGFDLDRFTTEYGSSSINEIFNCLDVLSASRTLLEFYKSIKNVHRKDINSHIEHEKALNLDIDAVDRMEFAQLLYAVKDFYDKCIPTKGSKVSFLEAHYLKALDSYDLEILVELFNTLGFGNGESSFTLDMFTFDSVSEIVEKCARKSRWADEEVFRRSKKLYSTIGLLIYLNLVNTKYTPGQILLDSHLISTKYFIEEYHSMRLLQESAFDNAWNGVKMIPSVTISTQNEINSIYYNNVHEFNTIAKQEENFFAEATEEYRRLVERYNRIQPSIGLLQRINEEFRYKGRDDRAAKNDIGLAEISKVQEPNLINSLKELFPGLTDKFYLLGAMLLIKQNSSNNSEIPSENNEGLEFLNKLGGTLNDLWGDFTTLSGIKADYINAVYEFEQNKIHTNNSDNNPLLDAELDDLLHEFEELRNRLEGYLKVSLSREDYLSLKDVDEAIAVIQEALEDVGKITANYRSYQINIKERKTFSADESDLLVQSFVNKLSYIPRYQSNALLNGLDDVLDEELMLQLQNFIFDLKQHPLLLPWSEAYKLLGHKNIKNLALLIQLEDQVDAFIDTVNRNELDQHKPLIQILFPHIIKGIDLTNSESINKLLNDLPSIARYLEAFESFVTTEGTIEAALSSDEISNPDQSEDLARIGMQSSDAPSGKKAKPKKGKSVDGIEQTNRQSGKTGKVGARQRRENSRAKNGKYVGEDLF